MRGEKKLIGIISNKKRFLISAGMLFGLLRVFCFSLTHSLLARRHGGGKRWLKQWKKNYFNQLFTRNFNNFNLKISSFRFNQPLLELICEKFHNCSCTPRNIKWSKKFPPSFANNSSCPKRWKSCNKISAQKKERRKSERGRE